MRLPPRIPALLELPKTNHRERISCWKAEWTRAMTKATSIVLGGSCADFDGDSEHILDSNSDSCACRKWHEAEKWEKVDLQKYDVCRCDWLLVMRFHTVMWSSPSSSFSPLCDSHFTTMLKNVISIKRLNLFSTATYSLMFPTSALLIVRCIYT